jgi:hypothetical protein
MAGTPGAYTSDHIPTSQLYTEFLDKVELHNEQDQNFRQLLCSPDVTKKSTVEVDYRGMEFQKMGSDTDQPDMQHKPYRRKTLTEPTRWGLNASITRTAWEKGLSSTKIRKDHDEALRADFDLVTQACLQPCLTDGGWYDTTLTPPPYQMNTFDATHDHYVASAAGGVLTLSMFADDKRHIREHGYTHGNIVSFIHGEQATNLEGIADWNSTNFTATSQMDELQRMGFTPQFIAAGVPVIQCDWIPENYMLTVDLAATPLMWRIPESDEPTNDLMVFTSEATTPNVTYQWVEDYIRWVSATVVAPGAGVARYLDGVSWVDSSGWLTF